MPDANGNFKSAFFALSAERHSLIFGAEEPASDDPPTFPDAEPEQDGE